MFTIDDFKKLDARLGQITSQKVKELEVSSNTPPTLDDLPDSNKAYALYASILFVDIRKSTQLTEASHAKSMVKIYRAFMRMAVSCVRANGGVTRQFLGDRIMGVFLDSVDDSGNVLISSVDKAVETARAMQTCIDYSLNKHLKNHVGGKTIACGIGIDYGKVLLTKVGMYGVEKDDSKENETDCVWVGNCTNKASKYSDLADGGEIFISENVYSKLSPNLKPENIWLPAAKHKGNILFNGYTSQNNYLKFASELDAPIVPTPSENEDAWNLAEAIKQIGETWNGISKKEGELKALEADLNARQRRLAEQAEDNKRDEAKRKIEKEALLSSQRSFYDMLCGCLQDSYCKPDYTSSMGYEFWMKLVDNIYSLGRTMGKSDEEITSQNDCYLIDLYEHFSLYDKAYDAMVIMAKKNRHWVMIKKSVLLWAREQSVVWKLRTAIEARLKNYSLECNRENFSKALKEIKDIVGY